MKDNFLKTNINFITKYFNYSDEDLEKISYGLEGIYLTITKLIVLIVLSLILGIFKEAIITLLLFNIIRYTGFGFHAETSFECLILSIVLFVLVPFILIKINLANSLIYLISSLCIISYLLYAPADTPKRPLLNKKKRLIRKILTVLIGLIYILLIYLFNNSFIKELLLSSLIIEAIIINPLTYKIFRQSYNNYKNY